MPVLNSREIRSTQVRGAALPPNASWRYNQKRPTVTIREETQPQREERGTDITPEGKTTYKIGDVEITREEYERYDTLSDRGRFDFLVSKDIIPKGSEYVPPLTQTEVNQANVYRTQAIKDGFLPADTPEIEQARGWAYLAPEQIKQQQEYRKELETWADEFVKQSEIKKPIMDKLSHYGNDKEGYNIQQALKDKAVTRDELLMFGFKQSDIDGTAPTYEKTVKKDARIGGNEVDELADYKAGSGYDIARYLRDNPADESYLIGKGFAKEDVDEAKKFNAQMTYFSKTNYEKVYDKMVANGFPRNLNMTDIEIWYEKHPEYLKQVMQAKKEDDAAVSDKAIKQKPTMSLANYTEAYLQARGITRNNGDRELYKGMAETSYRQNFGSAASVGSTLIEGASFVFSPARIAQPDVQFKDISGAEWAVGVGQVATIVLVSGAGSAISKSLPLISRTLQFGAVGTMAAGGTYITVKDWSQMSPNQRALSVAIDVALIVATARAFVKIPAPKVNQKLTAKRYIQELQRSAEPEVIAGNPERFIVGEKIITVEEDLKGKISQVTTNTTAETVASYREMILDQSDYAKGIKNEITLERKVATYQNALDDIRDDPFVDKVEIKRIETKLTGLQSKLADAKSSNISTKTQLENSIRGYTDNLRDAAAKGYIAGDESMVRSGYSGLKNTLDDLPRDIPRQTEEAIRELMSGKGNKGRITALEVDIKKLRTEIEGIREKHPTDPSAYSDLTAELRAKESYLEVLRSGDIKTMEAELIATRDTITDLKKLSKLKMSEKSRLQLFQDLKEAEDKATALEANLYKGLNQAEEIVSVKAEYNPKTGAYTTYKETEPMIAGSQIKTKPKGKLPILSGGGSSTKPSTATMTPEQVALLTGATNDSYYQGRPLTVVETTTKPVSVPKWKPTSAPEWETAKQGATAPDVSASAAVTAKTAQKLQTISESKANTENISETRPAFQTQPQTQAQTKAQVQTKTAVKTALKFSPNKEPNMKFIGIRFPVPPQGGGKKKRKKMPKGSVTWQQGIGWWTRKPPYRLKDSEFTLKKPIGAVAVKDSKSAFDTIQTISGLPPDKIPTMPMGIVDVKVTNPPYNPRHNNRQSIQFVPTETYRRGNIRITTGEPDDSHIKVRERKQSFGKMRKFKYYGRYKDLGAGIIQTRTKNGLKRRLKLY